MMVNVHWIEMGSLSVRGGVFVYETRKHLVRWSKFNTERSNAVLCLEKPATETNA